MTIPSHNAADIARQQRGGAMTADGRSLAIEFTEAKGRPLPDILKPGQTFTGLVLEKFANGSYLFNVRGRHLIADSKISLQRDSVVQFEALTDPSGKMTFRLSNTGLGDTFSAQSSQQQFVDLGLPDNALSRLLLQRFAQFEAPLTPPSRLQHALSALQQLIPNNTEITPQQLQNNPTLLAQIDSLASAHALVAKNNLPATPALLQLAEHQLQQTLPQQAQSFQQASQQLPPLVQEQLSQALTYLQNQTQSPKSNNLTPQTSNTTLNNPLIHADNIPQTSLKNITPPSTGNINNTSSSIALGPILEQILTLFQRSSEQIQTPISRLNELQSLGQQAFQNSIVSFHSEMQNLDDLATQLQQQIESNIKPRQDQQEALLKLTQLLMAQDAGSEARDMAMTVARDMLGDILFKPQALNDYSVVVPIPIMFNGQAQSARLALKQQTLANGTEATFMRVDIELSKLGSLSIRLNHSTGIPLALTLVGQKTFVDAFTPFEEELHQALTEIGIENAIRVRLWESEHEF